MIQLEVGDVAEVAEIVGNQGEIVMKGCGRNEKIKISDELASKSQLPADEGKVSENCPVQGQHLSATQETQEDFFVSFRIAP